MKLRKIGGRWYRANVYVSLSEQDRVTLLRAIIIGLWIAVVVLTLVVTTS